MNIDISFVSEQIINDGGLTDQKGFGFGHDKYFTFDCEYIAEYLQEHFDALEYPHLKMPDTLDENIIHDLFSHLSVNVDYISYFVIGSYIDVSLINKVPYINPIEDFFGNDYADYSVELLNCLLEELLRFVFNCRRYRIVATAVSLNCLTLFLTRYGEDEIQSWLKGPIF